MPQGLRGYARDYRKYGFRSCVCAALGAMVELVTLLVMADIIGVDVANGDEEHILRKGLEMCLLALIVLALGMMYIGLTTLCDMKLGGKLHKAEYQRIQSSSFTNTDHLSTSSLVTRLTSNITVIQNTVITGLRPVVRAPIMIVTVSFLPSSINGELALIFLVTIPIPADCLYYIICHVRPLYPRMQTVINTVNRIAQESLAAIRFMGVHVREDYEMEKLEGIDTELQTVPERALDTVCLNMPAMQYAMYGIALSILWFGDNLIFIGGMQVGELTGFPGYVFQILNPPMMISNVFMILTRFMASGHRILEVLDEEIEIKNESTEQLGIRTRETVFENIYSKYRKDTEEFVLSGVSFHILPGQTVGIIGSAGSAKTTLVQLIPRLYKATGGTVYADDRPVLEYPLGHLRGAITMVFQKNTLFSGIIREDLRWGREDATPERIKLACETVGVDELVERFPGGYQIVLEQGDMNLPGGRKQRLCITRVILGSSKIPMLNDSVSAVDTAIETRIRGGLAKNLKDTTKIIIARRIISVLHTDQIIIMDDGEVRVVGNHESLLVSDSIYQEAYHSQQEGAGS